MSSLSGSALRVSISRAAFALALSLCAVHPASAKPRPARAAAPVWAAKPAGQVIFVVSIADQRLTVYDNGVPVERAPVSTGVEGHLTPRGVFTIIQKDRYHESNIYSNAPMPYMQRITWSGVALHEGHVTGRPASHGCIRLPHDVAVHLWTYAKIGMRVIVADRDVAPYAFSDPHLFAAAKHPPLAASAAAAPARFAQVADRVASDAAPAAAAATVAETTKPADAPTASETAKAAPVASAVAQEPQPTATIDTAPTATIGDAAPAADAKRDAQPGVGADAAKPSLVALPPPEPAISPRFPDAAAPIAIPAGAGHVSMFVSRRTGKLYVRRGFEPIFEAPVVIRDAATPLGLHVFTAMDVTDDETRWSAVDLEDPQAAPVVRRHKGEPAEAVAARRPSTAAEALDRIVIPDDVRAALADLIVPGASLIVSDQGFGRETGKGTDFVVLTR